MTQIDELWHSSDPGVWDRALERYWTFVQPRNKELERSLEALDLDRLRRMDAQAWYEFLRDEYCRWKYTALNRYATTTARLRDYLHGDNLNELDRIRKRLLILDTDDIRSALIEGKIRGLGPPGVSGLLALMYPRKFGTVDQFTVKALRDVSGLPEAESLARMNPVSLTILDSVLLIGIFRRKSVANNLILKATTWTPRKVDKVLWTYGR